MLHTASTCPSCKRAGPIAQKVTKELGIELEIVGPGYDRRVPRACVERGAEERCVVGVPKSNKEYEKRLRKLIRG